MCIHNALFEGGRIGTKARHGTSTATSLSLRSRRRKQLFLLWVELAVGPLVDTCWIANSYLSVATSHAKFTVRSITVRCQASSQSSVFHIHSRQSLLPQVQIHSPSTSDSVFFSFPPLHIHPHQSFPHIKLFFIPSRAEKRLSGTLNLFSALSWIFLPLLLSL